MGLQMRVVDKFTWRWLIFVFCLLTFGAAGLRTASEEAGRQYQNVQKSDWGAANVWLRSAECTRETGAWLAICNEGKLFPIASFALADDPGHAFLLGQIARLKDRSVSVLDVARLNILINFVGIVAVAGLLFAARLEVAALIVLMLGSGPYFSWVGASPHPGLIGVATMAFIFPMTIVFGVQGYLSGIKRVLFLVLGGALLGLAAMLREPIGTMGLVVSTGALAYVATNKSGLRWKLRLLILMGVVVFAWQAPRWILTARDALFPIQPASLIQTHGISHNLYIGLGAGGENKFGIRWDDSEGDAAVKRVDPNVQYVSPEYFRILWRLYLNRLAEDPVEVIRIYAAKSLDILKYRLPEWAPPLWLMIISSCGLLMVGYRQSGRRDKYAFGAIPIVVVMALAFIGMFIAQGVLAHPSRQYAHPIGGFVLFILAVGFELLVQLRSRRDGKS